MTNLNKVFTIQEASARFNIPASTLKSYCAGQAVMQKDGKSYHYPPKFLSTDCRLAGKTWLITLEALERMFGDPAKKESEEKLEARKTKVNE